MLGLYNYIHLYIFITINISTTIHILQVTSYLAEWRGLKSGERLAVPDYFLAGMCAGGIIAFVEGPIDLVRS
jgi:hypothetical protein